MKPIEQYGYNAVGPGWRNLLEILDSHMSNAVENAVINATEAFPQYKREGNTPDARVEILQVKEKFGGLRVYFRTHGMEERLNAELFGAISFAESMSLRTCEKCGDPGTQHGTETCPNKRWRYGRVLTLCEAHHAEREACREEGKPFELGNEDKTA